MSAGIYSRAKKQIELEKAVVTPKVQQELDILKDYRKQLDSFMAQLEKAEPKFREFEELMLTTKIVKAVQTDTRDLDKVERDTLIMFQTYLKMQGVVQPE